MKSKTPKGISALIADNRNANLGTERGAGMLERSLERYGAGRSILIDRNGKIIAGNKTVAQAKALGLDGLVVIPSDGKKLIAVQRTDLDLDRDPKARALALADNRVAEVDLQWDADELAALSKEIDLGEFFDADELAELLPGEQAEAAPAPEPKLDRAEELGRAWQTAPGQIWEIPSLKTPSKAHRLACSDSGDPEAVARLMGAHKGALMATDPPYGVAMGIDSGPESAKRFSAIAGDEADGPRLQAFLEKVFHAAVPHLIENAAWYLWHAQLTQGFFAAAAAAAQLLVHRQIIWVKSHFILGHGDFHWQHELCFYGWRQGHRARWFGDRSQSTLWEVPNPRAHDAHPTQKPPELFARPMRLNTLRGEICYEPFAGSGSQLCAAEQEGRLCFAAEIEPKYVAVALQRLREMGLAPRVARP